MDIEEFEQQEIERIRNFCKDWKENNEKDPLNWPLDLDVGEWVEQYQCFVDLEDEDEQ